jgi:hypothetical protein
MSQPQVSYILQYVSGMVSLSADPDGDDFLISAQVNFYLVNRGTSVQTAQIQIWSALPNTRHPSMKPRWSSAPTAGRAPWSRFRPMLSEPST